MKKLTQTDVERDLEKDLEKLRKKAGKVFGGGLDFIDSLPNPPEKPETPFPYGGSGAKPYGWFSN